MTNAILCTANLRHTLQLTYAINNSIYLSVYLRRLRSKKQSKSSRTAPPSFLFSLLTIKLPVQLFVVENVFHFVPPLCCHSSFYTCSFFAILFTQCLPVRRFLSTVTLNVTLVVKFISLFCFFLAIRLWLVSSVYFSCYLPTL